MFTLNSNIVISGTNYKYSMFPHEVKVNKSIYEYVNRAVIKLPISARIINEKGYETATVETAKQFNAGDKVVIQLGYNGSLNIEFTGFVRRINFTSPVEVECEGYSYQLRMKTYTKSFINVQLIDILKYLIVGTDIILDEANIPAFKIDKLVFNGANGCQVLEEIKKVSHNVVQIFFSGNKLWAGLIYLDATGALKNYPSNQTVKYQLGWNVIKDNNLKQRQSNGDMVTVFEGIKKDGTKQTEIVNGRVHKVNAKVIQSSGGQGLTKKFRTTAITDAASLNSLSMAAQYKFNYDGYEGKITGFLQPFCDIAWRAQIIDKRYPERIGTYNVESVEVTYGMHGARRIVGIGIKLN